MYSMGKNGHHSTVMGKNGYHRSRGQDLCHCQNVPTAFDHKSPPTEAEAADALAILTKPAITATVPVADTDTALAPIKTNNDHFYLCSQMILLMNKNNLKKNVSPLPNKLYNQSLSERITFSAKTMPRSSINTAA